MLCLEKFHRRVGFSTLNIDRQEAWSYLLGPHVIKPIVQHNEKSISFLHLIARSHSLASLSPSPQSPTTQRFVMWGQPLTATRENNRPIFWRWTIQGDCSR